MSTYFEQAKEKPLDKWPLYNYLISMTLASDAILLGQFSLYEYDGSCENARECGLWFMEIAR